MIQTPTNYATPTSVTSRDALDATHKNNRYRKAIFEQIC